MKKLLLLQALPLLFASCNKTDEVANGTMGYLTYDGQSHKITDVGLYIMIDNNGQATWVDMWVTTGELSLDFNNGPDITTEGPGYMVILLLGEFDGCLEYLPAGTYNNTDMLHGASSCLMDGDYQDFFTTSQTLEAERNGNNYTFHYNGTLANGKQVTFNWQGTPKTYIETE